MSRTLNSTGEMNKLRTADAVQLHDVYGDVLGSRREPGCEFGLARQCQANAVALNFSSSTAFNDVILQFRLDDLQRVASTSVTWFPVVSSAGSSDCRALRKFDLVRHGLLGHVFEPDCCGEDALHCARRRQHQHNHVENSARRAMSGLDLLLIAIVAGVITAIITLACHFAPR